MGMGQFNEIPFMIPKEERYRGCKKAFRNLVWVLEEIAGKKESLAFLSSLVKELENEQVHKESD